MSSAAASSTASSQDCRLPAAVNSNCTFDAALQQCAVKCSSVQLGKWDLSLYPNGISARFLPVASLHFTFPQISRTFRHSSTQILQLLTSISASFIQEPSSLAIPVKLQCEFYTLRSICPCAQTPHSTASLHRAQENALWVDTQNIRTYDYAPSCSDSAAVLHCVCNSPDTAWTPRPRCTSST
jgi:hypothetical protein